MRPIFALALLAAACAPVPPDTPDAPGPGPGDVLCGAAELASLVGGPADALPADLPPATRIIPPGTAITKDFRPDRLNVDLDAQGTVTRIWCG